MFSTSDELYSHTAACQVERLKVKDKEVTVIDTPGFGDNRQIEVKLVEEEEASEIVNPS